jgi:hypothetical protein
MLATLPTEQTADFERSVYKLDNIDVAFLYVSLPRHLRADDEFPVEVTLILPQRMGPGSTPSISSEVEEGQKRLAAATGNKDAMQVGYDAAEYDLQKIPFVGFESPFKTGALKLAGGEFVVTSLAPETQTLKPLHAAFWSWTLKGKSPGDAFIYFSVSATDRDGTVLTRVIPMKLHLSRNWISSVGDFAASHVEWIVGTAVIPVLAFLWGLWIKRRSNAKSS